MRVGVDISASHFNSAGTARYSLELLKALQARDWEGLEVVGLRAASGLRVPAPGLARKLFVLYWEWLYAPFVLRERARGLNLEVLHCTAPLPLRPDAWPGRTRVVTTLHDVIPFSHPQWFPAIMRLRLRRWIGQAARSSQHLIASSEFTKKQIGLYLKMPGAAITVVYPGQSFVPSDTLGLTEPFLLTVGTLEPRKNLLAVLQAYSQLKQELPHLPTLLVVGRQGWGRVALREWLVKLRLTDHVRLLGFVPDERLFAFYSRAVALIYPSLQEGFGFPPLEAMASGCPVVVSNTSSLPEVVGEAGLLVDPQDSAQIAAALRRILTDETLAGHLRQAGLAQARQFSWDRCARETVAVYRQVLAA